MRLNVKDGSTVDLGDFETEETVLIAGARNLTITGLNVESSTTGAKVNPDPKNGYLPQQGYNWPRTRSHVLFRDCYNLRVEAASVQGPNKLGGVDVGAYVAALEAQHAFELWNCHGVVLGNIAARNVYGDFLYIGRGTTNVECTHHDFARNGRMGIAFTDAENIWVHDGQLTEMRRSAYDFEPNTMTASVRNVKIQRERLGARRLNFVSGVGKGDVSNVLIEDIESEASLVVDVRSPAGIRRKNWTIQRCRSPRPYGSTRGAAIIFRDVDGVNLRDLDQPLQANRGMVVAKTVGCTGVNIS